MKQTLATLGIAVVLALDVAHSRDDSAGVAVSYCRNRIQSIQLREVASRQVASGAHVQLSEDRTTLCFDGKIDRDQEMAPVRNLEQNGLFVMRSPGGHAGTAMEIANILREKNAVVVLYDYCFSACANYILVVSGQTYVTKDTIVAWHGGASAPDCRYPDAMRIFSEKNNLSTWTQGQKEEFCKVAELQRDFFRTRGVDDAIAQAPQSNYTRKMLRLSAQLSGYRDRNVFWMWNPKHYGGRFKSAIVYESYPDSQDEVDEILRRHFFSYARVIYDP
jgi:hypothetical protein